jgi:uncharacterized membrane protein
VAAAVAVVTTNTFRQPQHPEVLAVVVMVLEVQTQQRVRQTLAVVAVAVAHLSPAFLHSLRAQAVVRGLSFCLYLPHFILEQQLEAQQSQLQAQIQS